MGVIFQPVNQLLQITAPHPGFFSFQSKDMGTGTFYFPFPDQQDQRVFHLNRSGGTIQDIEHMEGSIITTGTGPNAPGYGEATLTFNLTPPYLQAHGYQVLGKTMTGIDGAIEDFFRKVVGGGLGCLIEYYEPHDGSTGLWSRQTDALLNGDVTVTRMAGGTMAQIECTIIVPSGKWTLNDGTKLYFY